MNESKNKRPQLNRDYTTLKFEAAVLYIKNGLSAKEISERLNVSMPTLHNWRKTGQWSELRPDMELLTQYKAANLYIIEKLAPGLIAQKLSVSEMTVNYWATLNGWNTARLVSDALKTVNNVLAAFCAHFINLFPGEAAKIELAHNEFLKELNK